MLCALCGKKLLEEYLHHYKSQTVIGSLTGNPLLRSNQIKYGQLKHLTAGCQIALDMTVNYGRSDLKSWINLFYKNISKSKSIVSTVMEQKEEPAPVRLIMVFTFGIVLAPKQ